MRLVLLLSVAAIVSFLCIPNTARGGDSDAVEQVVTDKDVASASERLDSIRAAYHNARLDWVAIDLGEELAEAQRRWHELSEARKAGVSVSEYGKTRMQTDPGAFLYGMLVRQRTRYERLLILARTDAAAQYCITRMREAEVGIREANNRLFESKEGKASEQPKGK